MHMAQGKTIKWHMRTFMIKINHFLPYLNFYVQIYSTEVFFFFFKLMKAFILSYGGFLSLDFEEFTFMKKQKMFLPVTLNL